MRLAVRMTLAAWRAAPWRIAVSVLGVAIGIVLVLATVSLDPALNAQRDRVLRRAEPLNDPAPVDPLLWSVQPNAEPTAAGNLTVIAVAPTGPRSPLPLGADATPRPDEVLVSPALARFLASPDGSTVRGRLPGPVVGRLHRDVLGGPRDLVMMIGTTPDRLSRARPITGFSDRTPRSPAVKPTRQRQLLTIVAGVGLLLPILAFVHASLMVSARRREQRFAALRLVGATSNDIRRVATTEALMTATVGTLAGVAIGAGLRAALETPTVAGFHFFAADLRPPPAALLATIAAVPLVAVGVGHALWRSVELSPLGITRKTARARRNPRLGMLLMAAGWAVLLFGALRSSSLSIGSLGVVVGLGFGTVLLGFIGAAPIAVRLAGRSMNRWSARAWVLLARRRLEADPAGAARAAGGVAVAALVAATALVYFPSHQQWAEESERVGLPAAQGGLVQADGVVLGDLGADIGDRLRGAPGVVDVMPFARPLAPQPGVGLVVVATCDRFLRAVRRPAPCDPAEPYVSPMAAASGAPGPTLPALGELVSPPVRRLVPPNGVQPRELGPFAGWIIATDGSQDAAEAVRKVVLQTHPTHLEVAARSDRHRTEVRRSESDQDKLEVAAMFMLAVGTARLLLALVEGLATRRRELALLIAQGTSPAVLRRATLAEFGVPMIVLSVLGALTGALVAATILTAADVPVAVSPRELAATGASFLAASLVCAAVASVGVGRSFDVRALTGNRA